MSSRRRILLLITDLEIGGTPTVVRELALRLREPGRIEVEVACLAQRGPVGAQIASAGVRVTAFDARGVFGLPAVVCRLVRLVRAGRFDTVFSFLVHANAVSALASVFLPAVRFLQSIQTTQPGPRWHWRVQRLASRAAESVVVPSPSAARAARRWAGVPACKIVVIPNAVDAGAFERSTALFADPRPYPIGFIGRLDPVKRIDVLIDAARSPMLAETVALHVYGEGRQRPELERHIRSGPSGVPTITLHGAVDRPQEALKGMGLLVLPSLAEGFGLVLIEAMAAGVPVVASDAPGIRDVVRDGETGLLVSPSPPSAHDLALAVRRIITDQALRRRLIDNGLTEVRRRYSWSIVLPQYRRALGLGFPSREPGSNGP